MLSYFLGGGDGTYQGYSAPPQADFASTATSSPLSSLAGRSDDQQVAAASWQMLPPTPAVQFYSHTPQHQHHNGHIAPSKPTNIQHHQGGARIINNKGRESPVQQHPPMVSTSQSSSSSSLSSMAAAQVSGVGPGMLNYSSAQQLHLQRVVVSRNTTVLPTASNIMMQGSYAGGESPISPVAMFGSEHENLMLPSPIKSSSPDAYGAQGSRSTDMQRLMGPPEPRQPTFSWPQPGSSSGDPSRNNDSSSMPTLPPLSMIAPMFPRSAGSAGHPMMSGGYPLTMAASPHATSFLSPQQQQQMIYSAAAVHAASLQQHGARGVVVMEEESEEKRAKRLERNRESARKCRRRKKERLATLGAQVNRLHNQIEDERRKLINSMVPTMQKCRRTEIVELLSMSGDDTASEEVEDKLLNIVRGSGPSSPMMRSVLEFQYTTLKELTLPHYHKMLLWLTLRDEKYFFEGKEQYLAKQLLQQQNCVQEIPPGRPSAVKISSKQIGDDLLNGAATTTKHEKKSAKKRDKDSGGSDGESKASASSSAFDAARTWPLFCFELKFSVDQEERFLAVYKKVTEARSAGGIHGDLAYKRSQMAEAVITIDSLGKAVGSLGHVIARREERSLLGILKPGQVAAYQIWLAKDRNRQRSRLAVAEQQISSSSVHSASNGMNGCANEVSLADISRRLSEVLQISTKSDGCSRMLEI